MLINEMMESIYWKTRGKKYIMFLLEEHNEERQSFCV